MSQLAVALAGEHIALVKEEGAEILSLALLCDSRQVTTCLGVSYFNYKMRELASNQFNRQLSGTCECE